MIILYFKVVERSDQIVPYYVMDTTKHLPGMAGVFLAGIVSSALSAMSAGINTLSGLIYDDFIDQYLPVSSNKDARAANIMKVWTKFLKRSFIAVVKRS